MRALGIDSGIDVTGFAFIEEEDNCLFHVHSGTIDTSGKADTSKRLHAIYTTVEKMIRDYKPYAVALEKGFYARNINTVIRLSQVNGVIMLASANSAIPVFEYTPLEVKLSVVGYGGAKKRQVQYMVSHILKLDKIVGSHHVADAMAIAICHIHRSKLKEML